jgi:hypothetical protein
MRDAENPSVRSPDMRYENAEYGVGARTRGLLSAAQYVRLRETSNYGAWTAVIACPAGHQPAVDRRYFAFFTLASIFDEMGRASGVTFGFLGCFGLRISRPPLFFGIGSPISGMDPVVLRAAVFGQNADATPVHLAPRGVRATSVRAADRTRPVRGIYVRPEPQGMPTIAAGQKIDFLRPQALTSRNARGG